MVAACRGWVTCVQLLLECGASVDLCTVQPEPCTETVGTAGSDNNGFDLKLWDEDHSLAGFGSPLSACIPRVRADDTVMALIRVLLSYGANVDCRGGQVGSPLGAAISAKRFEAASVLLTAGADISLEDTEGRNIALKMAVSYEDGGEGLRWLFERGAYAGPMVLNAYLHMAAEGYQEEIVWQLIDHGADPHSTDVHGRNALHNIAEGHRRWPRDVSRKLPRIDDRVAMAETLLDLGVDINAVGGEYNTVLIAASVSSDPDLVRLFLFRGADIHHSSDEYGTALEAAGTVSGGEHHDAILDMLSIAVADDSSLSISIA